MENIYKWDFDVIFCATFSFQVKTCCVGNIFLSGCSVLFLVLLLLHNDTHLTPAALSPSAHRSIFITVVNILDVLAHLQSCNAVSWGTYVKNLRFVSCLNKLHSDKEFPWKIQSQCMILDSNVWLQNVLGFQEDTRCKLFPPDDNVN